MTGGQSYVEGMLLKNLDELNEDLELARSDVGLKLFKFEHEPAYLDREELSKDLAQAEINLAAIEEATLIIKRLITQI